MPYSEYSPKQKRLAAVRPPRKKITKSTPKIASSLSKAEIERRCKKKRRNPSKRITGKKSRKPKKSRKSRKS